MADQNNEPPAKIKEIRIALYQLMNGEDRTGSNDATRSLLYALMEIVEKMSADVEHLKAIQTK